MADDKTFTKTELDAAIEAAVAKVQESVDRLEAKNTELVGDLRKARKAGEIKPEDLTAAEERADRAEAALSEANKQVKTLTTERDKAVKSLETEQGAARSYARTSDINGAIASGNVIPGLVDGFAAMIEKGSVTEMVDGKYVTKFGDKPVMEYVKEYLASEAGKNYTAAPVNGGGGAQGSSGGQQSGKTMLRSAFDGLAPAEQHAFVREGGKPVDA